jgi:tetratricopeptide (TPR) repeat protein
MVLQGQGRLDEALAAFTLAGQYSPQAPESHFQRGIIYLQRQQYGDAEAAMLQALAIQPQYPQAHYNLGLAQFNQGRVEESLESFRRATQMNGSYADAYYSAGLAFTQLGRYEEARTVLEYAKNLYITMGNPDWAAKAQNLLGRLPD